MVLAFLKKLLKRIPFVKKHLYYKAVATAQEAITLQRRQVEEDFRKEFDNFLATKKGNSTSIIAWEDRYPCLNDKTVAIGFDRHYLYHTAWAARVVKQINPEKHIDVSSLVYFPALLSAFVPVAYYDFRKPELELSNLQAGQADLLALPFVSDSVHSLSCMHTIEHVGLGRYGDPLDYEGDLKAMQELKRVVAKEGNLLLVVPIGKNKICFNAHRIYSYEQIVNYFNGFNLVEFSLIEEEGTNGLLQNPTSEVIATQTYGCGCFWFKKQ